MKETVKKGFSFGLVSGVITTLGLMVGLYFGTRLKLAVIGGILTIAIADGLSDSFGIHISEEFEKDSKHKDAVESGFYTFLFKFIFTLSFLIPIIFLELPIAILVGVVYGFCLIAGFSFFIARQKKKPYLPIIFEHVFLMFIVLILVYLVGIGIHFFFGNI
jgi:VIT1/CCC1 family predicted Fe2+/Mn2+ transporter